MTNLEYFNHSITRYGKSGADRFSLTQGVYISNHSYLVYTIDVSVILSEARRA